jgi:WD40 repeat protein
MEAADSAVAVDAAPLLEKRGGWFKVLTNDKAAGSVISYLAAAVRGSDQRVKAVSFNRDGSLLAASLGYNTAGVAQVRVFKMDTFNAAFTIVIEDKVRPVSGVAWDLKDSNLLLLKAGDNITVDFYDFRNGSRIKSVKFPTGAARVGPYARLLVPLDANRYLATFGRRQSTPTDKAVVWDVASGGVVKLTGHESVVKWVGASDAREVFFTADKESSAFK